MPVLPRLRSSELSDFPRPSSAVVVAVLTVRDDRLQVVVVDHRFGGLALPGTFLHEGERLGDAASRALTAKAALSAVELAQLKVFDDPARDERGWVLSVGHSGAVASRRLSETTRLLPITEGRPSGTLLFDHAAMVELAVEQLRRRYASELDPARLLDETFTVLQLRKLYQAVFGRDLVKDTFRRYIIAAIEATGDEAISMGRPAELFRRGSSTLLSPAFWAFLTK
jgi:8-oxo-dGTP diphosphatase